MLNLVLSTAIQGQSLHHFSFLLLPSIKIHYNVDPDVCSGFLKIWLSLLDLYLLRWIQGIDTQVLYPSCTVSGYIPPTLFLSFLFSFFLSVFPWPICFHSLTYRRWYMLWHSAQCLSVIKRWLCGKRMSRSTLRGFHYPLIIQYLSTGTSGVKHLNGGIL